MRNLLVFSLVALCAVLVSSQSAMAGGGGKAKGTDGKITFTNVDNESVYVYVRGPKDAVPATIGALKAKSILLNAGAEGSAEDLKNGDYQVFVAAAADFTNIDDGDLLSDHANLQPDNPTVVSVKGGKETKANVTATTVVVIP